MNTLKILIKNSSEEEKEFLKTRNFLLKELYYNNFYKEFL